MQPIAPKIVEFRAKLRQHWWVRAALAVLIVCSCLATIAGSAVVFECGARYITQANSIVIDAGSDDSLRGHPKPTTEQFIAMQAQLAVVTGRAMLLIALLMGACACGTLLTLVVGYLNDRAIMRRIEQLERTREAPDPRETPVGPMVKPRSAGRTTSRLRTAIIFGAIILAGTAIGLFAASIRRDAKWEENDARLVQQIAESATPSADDRSVPKQDFVLPGLQLQMIWVVPGRFSMGGGDGPFDGKPVTQVTLTHGFWLGKYELTQAQYNAVMRQDAFPATDVPAQRVSWNDAMEFCQRLTVMMRKAGKLPVGFTFTLPTEAQWEYACRAGTVGEYAGDVNAMAWYGGSAQVAGSLFFGVASTVSSKSGSGPYPVGRKEPNAWGFYDMHGNAQEWCRDWYAVQLPGGSVVDPTGPNSGVVRVERGGTWFQSAPECSSAARRGASPIHRTGEGFRVALATLIESP
jgi:formylglycine-generating enzyme required for sulfatase activity